LIGNEVASGDAVVEDEYVMIVEEMPEAFATTLARNFILVGIALCLIQIPISLYLIFFGTDEEEDKESEEAPQDEKQSLKNQGQENSTAASKVQRQSEKMRQKELAASFDEKRPLVADYDQL
jgi:hypothetical protein